MRGILALSLLFPTVVAPATVDLSIVEPSAILRVDCYQGVDEYVGTAFRVGPNGQFLSVNHVTESGTCTVGNDPLPKAWKSPTLDFSMFTGSPGKYITIDCGGFIRGHKYLAVGFARGLYQTTTVELTGTGVKDNGMAVLTGMVPVIPGQSGGPIVSEDTGRVVGVVDAENFEQGLSWSVQLKDTPICQGRIA